MAKTLVLSPFARIEGQLRVEVDVSHNRVSSAKVSGHLFRGFEWMLRGREPLEALVILCRICGQCSLAHSAAAAAALRDACHITPPPNAFLMTNVAVAAEFVLNHLLHFYTSFAPDFAQPPYDAGLTARFSLSGGRSQVAALRLRRDLLALLGLVAGKWPNSLAIQPAGMTRVVTFSDLSRAAGILGAFRTELEAQVLGGSVAQWLELRNAEDFERWLAAPSHQDSDLGVFTQVARAHGLEKLGAGPHRFVSSGGFELAPQKTWLRPGFFDGYAKALDAHEIVEHCQYAWYGADFKPCGADGHGEPDPTKANAYSWGTAPRYTGVSAETGPLARMLSDGDALALDLYRRHGPSVFLRVLMRWHETFRLVDQMARWLAEIQPEQAFFCRPQPFESGSGVSLSEAPRGLLVHALTVEKARIKHYQVITPTGWNFSPRDAQERPGPVEEALCGTPVADSDHPVLVSHVVRSFDPCLFCMVH